jgi:3-phenylpropionate/trans-cinnamate dioxygenase ferredoxin subunit
VTSMSNYIEVGRTDEFKDGTKKKVVAGGREVMLARAGDKYYAVGNRCPHMGGELAAGQLNGTVITCPRHGSQFDVTDGHNIRWLKGTGFVSAVAKVVKPPRSLPTYRVKVEGDVILIEV